MYAGIKQLSDLSPLLATLTAAEATVVFDLWWRRWRPLVLRVLAANPALVADIPRVLLLDSPWTSLDADQVRGIKATSKALSMFYREYTKEVSAIPQSAHGEFASALCDLLRQLLQNRREQNPAAAVRHIPQWLPPFDWAIFCTVERKPDNELSDEEALETDKNYYRFYTQPEVEWFEAVVASLRGTTGAPSLDDLAKVQPAVLRLLAIAIPLEPGS
jgi:hypothetical protein